MKHRKKLDSFSIYGAWGTPAFLFLTAVFLCGVAAGSLTGLRSAVLEGALVQDLVDAVLQANAGSNVQDLIFTSLLPALGWVLLALVCGGLPFHSLILAAVVVARGFLFAFAIAAMLGARGMEGILLSIVSCAAGGIFTLPCLLLAATVAFQAALDRPARAGGYLYALRKYRGTLLMLFLVSLLGGGIRIGAMLLARCDWFPT